MSVFDVKVDCGAVGDGISLDTNAFADCMNLVSNVGGGTVVVPPGDYLIAPINLTSHLLFFIQAGASLLGAQDMSLYPLIPPLPSYGVGRETPYSDMRYLSLVEMANVTNVTIQGEGDDSIIDGQGEYWWDLWVGGNLTYTRPHLIETMWASDINFYDIVLKGSGFWTNHWFDSDRIHAKNVFIDSSPNGPNTDGWDPDSSRDVLIEDSRYIGGDDCVAIKAGWGCIGAAYGVPTQRVHVRNVTCYGNGGSGGLAIGSEMNGGVEDVLFENIILNNSNYMTNMKRSSPGSGFFRNITFRDINVYGNMKQAARSIYIYLPGNPKCGILDDGPVEYSDLSWENIYCQDCTITENPTFGFGVTPISSTYWNNVQFPPNRPLPWSCSFTNVTYVEGTVTPEPELCYEITAVTLAPTSQPTEFPLIGAPGPTPYVGKKKAKQPGVKSGKKNNKSAKNDSKASKKTKSN